MSSYDYRPLNPEAHEIRLLQIQKSSDESAPITVTLKHASLDDRPPFNALSYTWGDETPTTQIAIRDGVTQGFVPVRRNLFEFLKEARQSTKAWSSEWIWIDQISINQSDQDERGHQVGQMRKVYSMSQATLVWPWSWSNSSLEAVEILLAECQVDPSRLICNTPERLSTAKKHSDSFYREIRNSSAMDLLRCLTYGQFMQAIETPYWERLWIIQELVLAPSYYIILNGETWNPGHFKQAIRGISYLLRGNINYRRQYTMFGNLRNFETVRVDRKSKESLSWASALYLSQDAHCTKPLDRVYGVMGLLHESLHVVPDYGISEVDLLRQILYKHMSSSRRELGRWTHIYDLLQVWRFSEPQQTVGGRWNLNLYYLEDYRTLRTHMEVKRVVRQALDELDIRISPPFTYVDVKFKLGQIRRL